MLILVLFSAFTLSAAENLKKPNVFIEMANVPTNSNRATIKNFLQARLMSLLSEKGFSPSSQNQANFLIKIDLKEVDNRVLVSLKLVDSEDKSIVYATQRLVFPGLLAETVLDEILDQTVSVLLNSQDRFVLLGSVEYALQFKSSEEGLKLWMGEGDGRYLLGEIREGQLEAPYFPFELGSTITLIAEKENRWPRAIPIQLTQEPVLATLDPLYVYSYQQAFLAISPSRLGIRVGYRYFPLPDKFMIGSDLFFSLHGLFKTNALPFYNQELRLSTGMYLFFPEDHWIRIMAGLASSIYLTVLSLDAGLNPFFDFSIEPIWLSLEWNQSFYTIFLELRVPYFLPNSDLLKPGLREIPWISIGGALKW